jgi:hypothetical protein
LTEAIHPKSGRGGARQGNRSRDFGSGAGKREHSLVIQLCVLGCPGSFSGSPLALLHPGGFASGLDWLPAHWELSLPPWDYSLCLSYSPPSSPGFSSAWSPSLGAFCALFWRQELLLGSQASVRMTSTLVVTVHVLGVVDLPTHLGLLQLSQTPKATVTSLIFSP